MGYCFRLKSGAITLAVRRTPVAIAAIALAAGATPAGADMAQYRQNIGCAAYHHFAASILGAVDKKTYKQQIKQHEHSSALDMEIAGALLDPANVPPARIRQDVAEMVQELLRRFQATSQPREIMDEAAAACSNFSFP